ncbi:MAG TPA: hypothetical protein VFJ90_16505 [Candidatus Didemnitutus sp.]|nr:hypothetical protein [Candidatus Didemnitutus sp.]
MSAIKVHLELAEMDPVQRLADLLKVSPEDIAYTALDRLMMHARDPEIQKEIVQTRSWKKDNLPLWADSAGSVHAYEGMPDCEPAKSKYSV